MSETPQFVSLRMAMEQMEATNEKEFVRVAKLRKCYFEKAGIVRIDVAELQRQLDQDFAAAQEQAAKRKAVTRSAGSDYGLIEARLKQAPDRIAKKNAKIAEADAQVKAAETPYQRRQAEKKRQKLLLELKALQDGQQRDVKRRDDFLNGDDSETAAA